MPTNPDSAIRDIWRINTGTGIIYEERDDTVEAIKRAYAIHDMDITLERYIPASHLAKVKREVAALNETLRENLGDYERNMNVVEARVRELEATLREAQNEVARLTFKALGQGIDAALHQSGSGG